MELSPTVRAIQNGSHAEVGFRHWLVGSGIVSALTGVAMPVALCRGHSLIKTVALGALADTIALGGIMSAFARCEGCRRQWNRVNSGELQDRNDREVAPYLAFFAEAYEVVDIDPEKETAAHLKEVWEGSFWVDKDCEQRDNAIRIGMIALAAGSALLLGSALVGRYMKGAQPWQRWLAIISCAAISIGASAFCWLAKRFRQQVIDCEYVGHTLGRVTINECLSESGLSGELKELLQNQKIWIRSFSTQTLSSDQIGRANGLVEPFNIVIKQDSKGRSALSRYPLHHFR